ncbi:hypothetical protein NHX12_027760 [Muraenolepis orangiensis]|uniref:Uncharacterized protein n=1 Tax=Muraenolepis orangiensis TaxID=630683 RepID=A0A9Q0EH82_9TELE|nr:hypothetical protein NHX12_027760 [Muraenolepis orangiensis]
MTEMRPAELVLPEYGQGGHRDGFNFARGIPLVSPLVPAAPLVPVRRRTTAAPSVRPYGPWMRGEKPRHEKDDTEAQ